MIIHYGNMITCNYHEHINISKPPYEVAQWVNESMAGIQQQQRLAISFWHYKSTKKRVGIKASKLHHQNKEEVMLQGSKRYSLSPCWLFQTSSKKKILFEKKKKKNCHGFQWMPVRIKRAIHAASWFRHASLHTNQPGPGLASHSLVCHSNTRWRQCQKFQLKYPFVMSVQKKGTHEKKKENKYQAFSIA